jgi:cytochrome c biogenesis protein CcdA
MTNPKPQTFPNHASFDPLYHIAGAILLLFLLIVGIIILVQDFHSELSLSLWIAGLTILLFITLIRLRTYPLKLQDRIIRLEERLRLTALLPEPLRVRISELSEDQLIGLRFASDDEIPTLVEQALNHHLDRKQIKERIQNWRPDHFRI